MRLFLLFVCAVVRPLLHGMEQLPLEIQKKIETFVLRPSDCYGQRTVAMLSKAHNEFIEQECRSDKKRIKELMAEKGTPIVDEKVRWNKNFTRCAWVTIGFVVKEQQKEWCYFSNQWRRTWGLTLVGLSDKGKLIECHKKRNGFHFPAIEGDMRPSFDKYGDIFFHAYADVSQMPSSIIKFTLFDDNELLTRLCFIGLKENEHTDYDFNYILNFPVLLKALLQSKKMEYYDKWVNFGMREHRCYYYISGATLPDDYKTYTERPFFKEHPNARAKYTDALWYTHKIRRLDYKGLPEELRNAIDGRYAEQQREKQMIEDRVDKK